MEKTQKSFLILNGKTVELSNLDVHNIELSLLQAQAQWLKHNATSPISETIPLVNFIAETGMSYWKGEVLSKLDDLNKFYEQKKTPSPRMSAHSEENGYEDRTAKA